MDNPLGIIIIIWLVVMCVLGTMSFKARRREAIASPMSTERADVIIDLLVLGFVSFFYVAGLCVAVGLAWCFISGLFD